MDNPVDNITKVRVLCLLALAREIKKQTQVLTDDEAEKSASTMQAQFRNIVTEFLSQEELVEKAAQCFARELDQEVHQMMRVVSAVASSPEERKSMLLDGIKHVCSTMLGEEVEL